MKILNLTQHQATPEQLDAGVVDLTEEQRKRVAEYLTFDSVPHRNELNERAHELIDYIDGLDIDLGEGGVFRVMIGGAPFFMGVLETVLYNRTVAVCYAFSKRESKDLSNGKKVSVFKHLGFVWV
jgi:hypothetical protein